MGIIVRVPTPLRTFTNGAEELTVNGNTIKEIINNLETNYTGIKERICDENGKIRRFINVYINEEDIRFLQNQDTVVKEGDVISIVPAIAGGENNLINCTCSHGAGCSSRRKGTGYS